MSVLCQLADKVEQFWLVSPGNFYTSRSIKFRNSKNEFNKKNENHHAQADYAYANEYSHYAWEIDDQHDAAVNACNHKADR